MSETNNSGFSGTASVGYYKVKFRHGYDAVSLKRYQDTLPINEFLWLRKDEQLIYKNKNGKFFKLNFEEINL